MTTNGLAQEARPIESAPPAGNEAIARGIYLQLGAFANAGNAENLKNNLSRELDWLNEPMRIYPGGGLHHLRLGPYASRGDADKVAERVRTVLGYKPTIVSR